MGASGHCGRGDYSKNIQWRRVQDNWAAHKVMGEGIRGSAWSRIATRSRQAGDVIGFFSLWIVPGSRAMRKLFQ